MKLSEMRQILAEHGIQLTKSLGQNFLHDANQLRQIVAAAELGRSDKVLEIGPGLGPLTELLLAEAGEVLAIEKDARLVEVLKAGGRRLDVGNQQKDCAPFSSSNLFSQGEDERVRERGRNESTLTLIHDDALEFLRRERRDWSEWKLVANLPYSAASRIVVELAQTERGPERMVVTLQLEVARRLMAGPDDPDYGLLSLLVQLNYCPKDFFKIPKSCFFPEPDVDSACVSLLRRPRPLLGPSLAQIFQKVVKRSFSQRRKMMIKLLKADWPLEKLERVFERLGLSRQSRAEEVSLKQFVKLAEALARLDGVKEPLITADKR